jgi:hypothetical protein
MRSIVQAGTVTDDVILTDTDADGAIGPQR